MNFIASFPRATGKFQVGVRLLAEEIYMSPSKRNIALMGRTAEEAQAGGKRLHDALAQYGISWVKVRPCWPRSAGVVGFRAKLVIFDDPENTREN